MRVAVYCPHYEDASGVREVARRIAGVLAAHDDAVLHVVRARRRSAGAAARDVPVVRVRLAPVPHPRLERARLARFARSYPARALRLVRVVREFRPDVIATHCSKLHAPWVAALRLGVRAPIVVHLHNAAETADGPEHRGLTRLLLRCATRVVAVSEAVAEYARTCLPQRAERVVCVPNGIDLREFAQAAPIVRARPFILGLGRLAAQKGFDLLIDAYAAAGLEDVDVVLAGDGPERDALAARAAAHGVAGRVHFLGSVDRATAGALLRGAALVAMPSRFEGHPLVALEAMQVGAPLVVADIPGMPETLVHDRCAWRVRPDDIEGLAAALRLLLRDDERRRCLGEAGRAAAAMLQSWDEVGRRVREIYRAAAGQTRS